MVVISYFQNFEMCLFIEWLLQDVISQWNGLMWSHSWSVEDDFYWVWSPSDVFLSSIWLVYDWILIRTRVESEQTKLEKKHLYQPKLSATDRPLTDEPDDTGCRNKIIIWTFCSMCSHSWAQKPPVVNRAHWIVHYVSVEVSKNKEHYHTSEQTLGRLLYS